MSLPWSAVITPNFRSFISSTALTPNLVARILSNAVGVMTALQGSDIVEVELYEVVGGLKTVNPELFEIAEVFFG